MGASVNMSPALPYIWDMIKNSLAGDQYDAAGRDEMPENSMFVDPAVTAKLREQVKTRQQTKEAAPFLNRLAEVQQAGMDNDPVWQQTAMDELTELQGYNAQKAPNNPLVQKGTQQAREGLQDLVNIARVADRSQRGEHIPGMDLAQMFKRKEGSSELAKLIDLGKYNDDLRSKRGVQDTINISAGASSNPLLQSLAKATQYGVSVGDFDKLAKVYGLDPVELKTVQAGDAKGNDQQYVFNPRTGATTGTVGAPQAAGRNATRVSVNPIIQQEGAFARGVGEANAKQYGAAIESKQNAVNALQSLAELKVALKNAPSGITAGAQYQAGRVLAPNSKTVAAYEVARNKQQELALNLLQNFKGAMSEKELKFVEEMAINPAMNRKAQADLIRISEGKYRKAIQQADTLISSVESDPVRSNINRTLSNSGATPKPIGQAPKTAADYMQKWR